MRTLINSLGLLILSAAFLVPVSYSAVPLLMNYQGQITDSTGSPINDTLDITFRIYIDSVTTTSEWIEIHNSVPIETEIIQLRLASITPFPVNLFDNDELWLGITIGTDPEITPRTLLVTVPYSFRAEGISGHFFTAPSSIYIPNLANTDTVVRIDTSGIYLPGTEIRAVEPIASPQKSVSLKSGDILMFNKYAGTEIKIDGDQILIMRESDLFEYVNISPSGIDLRTPDSPDPLSLPIFLTPDTGEVAIRLADDISGQLFATIISSGKLQTAHVTSGTHTDYLPDEILFMTNSGADTNLIIGNAGLDLRGNTLDLGSGSLTVGGDLTVEGSLLVDNGGTFGNGGTVTFTGTTTASTSLSDSGLSSNYGSVTITDAGGVTLASDLTAGSLTLSRDALEPLTLGTGGGSGGTVTLTSGAGGGTLRLTADSLELLSVLGDLRVNNGGVFIEPSGGGAGGRAAVNSEGVLLTDDLGTDSITIHRTDGLVLVLGSSGTVAVYTAGGVQLTGPTARIFAANPTSISTTRPSTNTAWAVDLDDASDLMYCDLNDDGVRDVSFQYTPTKELRLESGTGLTCDGPTSLNTCDVSGAATYGSTVDVSGTMTCTGATSLNTCNVSGAATYGSTVDVSGTFTCTGATSLASCDISSTLTCNGTMTCRNSVFMDLNNDATLDILCTATTTPTLTLAVGTDLDCLGPAFFSSPVLINSDLTVTGVKAFVQDHPEDDTKEIVYVALEGHEAGTYTRGNGQLDEGIATIKLPEVFSLVTNEDGLTAQITPRGPVQSMLYVESVTPKMLVVKSSDMNDGHVKFDFMINGVRAGFEDHQVIREKRSYANNN